MGNLLERGRNVEHIKDYEGTEKNPWELPHRNAKTEEDKSNSPIQSKCYAYDEVSKKPHFFLRRPPKNPPFFGPECYKFRLILDENTMPINNLFLGRPQ